jgi:hypothetical protein
MNLSKTMQVGSGSNGQDSESPIPQNADSFADAMSPTSETFDSFETDPLESIRIASKSTKSKKRNSRARLIGFLTLLLISATITLIGVSIHNSSGFQKKKKSKSAAKPTVVDAAAFETRFDTIRPIVRSFSNPKDFLRSNSPQSLAMQWLMSRSDNVDILDRNGLAQRYAVLVLFHACGGQVWKQLAVAPVAEQHKSECDLKGFRCDKDGAVVEISHADLGLSGRVPEELHLLSHLTKLDFSNNLLNGGIPDSVLSYLTNLGMVIFV